MAWILEIIETTYELLKVLRERFFSENFLLYLLHTSLFFQQPGFTEKSDLNPWQSVPYTYALTHKWPKMSKIFKISRYSCLCNIAPYQTHTHTQVSGKQFYMLTLLYLACLLFSHIFHKETCHCVVERGSTHLAKMNNSTETPKYAVAI